VHLFYVPFCRRSKRERKRGEVVHKYITFPLFFLGGGGGGFVCLVLFVLVLVLILLMGVC
jgi:hypothetical protein